MKKLVIENMNKQQKKFNVEYSEIEYKDEFYAFQTLSLSNAGHEVDFEKFKEGVNSYYSDD